MAGQNGSGFATDPRPVLASESSASSNNKAVVRRKFRPTYSCLSCHKRKVKCDRVKPCSACCLRGTPSECEYGTNKQDRHYIHQSTVIENLLLSCQALKQQLDETRKLANLPPIKDDIGIVPSSLSIIAKDDCLSQGSAADYTQIQRDSAENAESKSFDLECIPRSKSHFSTPDPDDAVVLNKASHSETERTSRASSSGSIHPARSNAIEFSKSPTSANVIVEILVARLIEFFSPADHLNSGSLVGLREAAHMRVLSPLLQRAFEAASLTFVGRQDDNRSMERAGHLRYTMFFSCSSVL